MFRHSHARALIFGATTLAALGVIDAQALPYNAKAGYEVNATTVSLPAQASATDVDILEFTTVDNVGVGIHTYGSGGTFGSRASADFFGPTSLAVVDSLFTLDLTGLGSSLTLNVTPGEVAVHGPAGGMAFGDFLSSRLEFNIEVDGIAVYHNIIGASLDNTSATSGEAPDAGNLVTLNLGLTCAQSFVGGTASCLIGGGSTVLDLDALSGGNSGPHTLLYTIFAETSGVVSDASGCGGGFNGGGEVTATAFIIEDGDGGNGGGNSCGAIARSGDPIPEPATFALAPLALVGVAVARRRQRRAD